MAIRFEVTAVGEAHAAAAASEFFRVAADAIRSRGLARVALAGGRTPRAAYERIAASWRDAPGGPVAWDRVHLFWGDERMVPEGDPRSNFGMAREALISRVPIPEANVHPIRGDAASPATAAARYEEMLRREFARNGADALPRFDLVFLGLGEDGHTASLFPGDPAAGESRRWVAATLHPESGEGRVTLTLPVLNNAAATVVLVSGRDKSAMLERAVRGRQGGDGARGRAEPLPAQRLRPTAGTLLWLADEDAAPWARSESTGPNT